MTTLCYYEDIPADKPQFDFDVVAKVLSIFLIQQHERACILGLHGPWGSGKTTLLRAIREELNAKLPKDSAVFIEFNAWKFQERESLWRALVLHVLGELHQLKIDSAEVERLEQSLYRAFEVEEHGPLRINWRSLITEIISIGLSVLQLSFVAKAFGSAPRWFISLFGGKADNKDTPVIDEKRVEKLTGFLERTTVKRHILQVRSVEQFLERFRYLISKVRELNKWVFILIDDLDRCLPEHALEVFEAIKLFLDAKGCAYVVALDRDVIRKGLAVRYAAPGAAAKGQSLINPDEYIEKTLSLSYDIPRLSDADVLELIGVFDLPEIFDQRHRLMILEALGHNPRRIKRFMNTLTVQLELSRLLGDTKPGSPPWNDDPRRFDYFLKLLMISYAFSDVFALFKEDPELIGRLQRVSNAFETEKRASQTQARIKRQEKLQSETACVQQLHEKEDLWRLLSTGPNFLDDTDLVSELLSWFRNRQIPDKDNVGS